MDRKKQEESRKLEGVAFIPIPVRSLVRVVEGKDLGQMLSQQMDRDLPCELCGAQVVAYNCNRVCLACGFMTGCSNGI